MLQKENILKNYPCLTQKDLEEILEVWIRLFLIARQAEIMAEITCQFILYHCEKLQSLLKKFDSSDEVKQFTAAALYETVFV